MTERLINADALYTLFVKMKSFGELTAKKAIRCVEEAPTVDAEPVEHGHWVDTTDYIGFPVWQCSKCNGDGRGDYFRCPWCGAKMGERTEE